MKKLHEQGVKGTSQKRTTSIKQSLPAGEQTRPLRCRGRGQVKVYSAFQVFNTGGDIFEPDAFKFFFIRGIKAFSVVFDGTADAFSTSFIREISRVVAPACLMALVTHS